MHWTALGFGLGIAAYFGLSRELGVCIFSQLASMPVYVPF